MAASSTLTYDLANPRRPSLDDDFHGAAKENHPKFPPNPITMMVAEEVNQTYKLAVALARMTPHARIFVTFTAGVASIALVQAMGTNVSAASFTLVENGVGDTSLRWAPLGVLPARAGGPKAFLTQNADATIAPEYTVEGASLNAVRVRTRVGGVLTDVNFCVEIF